MASFLYPHLHFAKERSRTDSGTLIRDLIFYNNQSMDFLREIHSDYNCNQIIFELENVADVTRDHIFRLNRYLKDQFGKFGIIVCRNPPLKKIYKNTIDLWSGQRVCILILDDSDLALMCNVFESKQRSPIEIKKIHRIYKSMSIINIKKSEDVSAFEKIQAQIQGLHSEISTLAKKSRNDECNKFKLDLIGEFADIGFTWSTSPY